MRSKRVGPAAIHNSTLSAVLQQHTPYERCPSRPYRAVTSHTRWQKLPSPRPDSM